MFHCGGGDSPCVRAMTSLIFLHWPSRTVSSSIRLSCYQQDILFFCDNVSFSAATAFKPNVLTFSSFEANRDSIPSFNLWYSWSDEMNERLKCYFWTPTCLMSAEMLCHVTECLVTDTTTMLIWINKQSKVTMTAPPRANETCSF